MFLLQDAFINVADTGIIKLVSSQKVLLQLMSFNGLVPIPPCKTVSSDKNENIHFSEINWMCCVRHVTTLSVVGCLRLDDS
jgi:hypothetical protein